MAPNQVCDVIVPPPLEDLEPDLPPQGVVVHLATKAQSGAVYQLDGARGAAPYAAPVIPRDGRRLVPAGHYAPSSILATKAAFQTVVVAAEASVVRMYLDGREKKLWVTWQLQPVADLRLPTMTDVPTTLKVVLN